MRLCNNCHRAVDEYGLDKKLTGLRDLSAEDFNVCAECSTVETNGCTHCGGAVYVPRSAETSPTICPACRADVLEQTGEDPGWKPTSA